MKKGFILTEGGSSIGFGHVTRCLSLYQGLVERGVDVEMIILGDGSISGILNNVKYRLFDWINDPVSLKQIITNADLLIIDSTIADPTWITKLSDLVKAMGIIDDLRRLDPDITTNSSNIAIIDWTPLIENEYSYKSNGPFTFLLGCPYICLRKAFWDLPDKKINDTISEVLVTMGGSDIRDISTSVVKVLLKELSFGVTVKVIIGRGFLKETIAKLEILAKDNNKIKLIYFPDENGMIDAFMDADLVVSSGGQTLYELARVGVPTIAIEVIENQRLDIQGWMKVGFIDYAGRWDEDCIYDKIVVSLHSLLDANQRTLKKEKGRSNVDGQGSRRIIDYLIDQKL